MAVFNIFNATQWLALAVTVYLGLLLLRPDVTGRTLRLVIALDVMLFAICTLGHSKRGETASAAAWSLYEAGKWQGKLFCPLIDWLASPWESGHCYASWLVENKQTLWSPRYG